MQAALVAHTFAALMSDPKKRRPRLVDFILEWGGRKRRQSGAEQLAIFQALAAKQKGPPRVDHR